MRARLGVMYVAANPINQELLDATSSGSFWRRQLELGEIETNKQTKKNRVDAIFEVSREVEIDHFEKN